MIPACGSNSDEAADRDREKVNSAELSRRCARRDARQGGLAWVADRAGVTAPICGARTVALHLDEKATTRLTEVSASPIPNYLYQMMERIAGSHS